MRPIYLDYNATTPVAPEVVEAMLPYFSEDFGNPSSSHVHGRRVHEAVERARSQVAAFIGASPEEIVFTGSGTEATNLALRGTALANPDRRHVVATAFEHPATSETVAWLERNGFRVSRAPVERDGRVLPTKLAGFFEPDTLIVSMIHAHNEIGTIQPVADVAKAARSKGVLVHTDAAQTLGKIPVDVDALGVDLLTIVGHKFYAPQGVGALYIRRGTRVDPVITGAGHERGVRPGTENVAGIVGLGRACELADRVMVTERVRQRALRERLLDALRAGVPGLVLHGHPTERLPNTLFLTFPGVAGAKLLEPVPELAASTGSACHTGLDAPCASLLAIGVPSEQAVGPVRLSLGRSTTVDEIERAAGLLTATWRKLAAQIPA